MNTLATHPDHALIYQAVREVSFDLAMAGVELDRPLTTRVKAGFNTACWTFNRDQHTIFMGDNVFPWDRAKPMDDEMKVGLYKALFRHELAHATSTVRDFPAMNAMCRRAKCEFRLLNIFEDARIEHLEREASGEKLGWADYLAQGLPNVDAEQIFFSMIETETRDVAAPDVDPALLERVQHYYDQVLACPTTEDLEPLLAQWQLEFPTKQQDQQQGGGGDGPSQPGQSGQEPNPSEGAGGSKSANLTADRGELPLSIQLSNDTNFDTFSEGTIDVADLDPAKKGSQRGNGGGTPVAQEDSLEWSESKKLAAMLKKAMQGVNRSVGTDVPGKKLNLKGMTRPGAPLFRRVELQGRKSLNLFFVVDISGSMSGEPIKNARLLAGALSILADQGLAEGKVLLSGSSHQEVFDLKEKDVKSKIEAIGATDGGEGFVNNFLTYQGLMKGRDAVLVFTDANTEDVDQVRLANNKIYPIGLYSGTDKAAPAQLAKNFTRFVVRDNIEELTFSLVQEFAKAARAKAQGRSVLAGAGATLSRLVADTRGDDDTFRIQRGGVSFNGVDASKPVRELAGVAEGVALTAADVRHAIQVAKEQAPPERSPVSRFSR